MSNERRPGWLRQAVTQAAARNQAETLAVIGLVVFVAIIIGALYLAQSTSTAITGRQLEQYVKTRDSFQRNNEDMIAQIAALKDINRLRERAQKLGFATITAGNQEYIVVNGYQTVRATATPEYTAVPTFVYEETFNGWLQQQIDKFSAQFEAWSGKAKATPIPK
jgi:cell division protein FtsB